MKPYCWKICSFPGISFDPSCICICRRLKNSVFHEFACRFGEKVRRPAADSILMPPTFPIARLNRYAPNFSGLPQKLTWCQHFGLQIFPKEWIVYIGEQTPFLRPPKIDPYFKSKKEQKASRQKFWLRNKILLRKFSCNCSSWRNNSCACFSFKYSSCICRHTFQ